MATRVIRGRAAHRRQGPAEHRNALRNRQAAARRRVHRSPGAGRSGPSMTSGDAITGSLSSVGRSPAPKPNRVGRSCDGAPERLLSARIARGRLPWLRIPLVGPALSGAAAPLSRGLPRRLRSGNGKSLPRAAERRAEKGKSACCACGGRPSPAPFVLARAALGYVSSGCRLCPAHDAPDPGLHGGRRPRARVRHRCEYRDLQPGEQRPAPALPYANDSQLVFLRQQAPKAGIESLGFSPKELADYRQQNQT